MSMISTCSAEERAEGGRAPVVEGGYFGDALPCDAIVDLSMSTRHRLRTQNFGRAAHSDVRLARRATELGRYSE